MRPPSRRRRPVPVAPPPRGIALRAWGAFCLAILVAFLAFLAWVVWRAVTEPIVGLSLCGLIAFVWLTGALSERKRRRRLARLAADRPGNPLCRFARAVDCRRRDTWVVRSVYEALQSYLPSEKGGPGFPVAPDDRLEADLGICLDDLDDDAWDIAHRCGRAWPPSDPSGPEPKIETVRQLLDFFERQPRVQRAVSPA